MTPQDIDYFKRCHGLGLVKNSLLEVGSAKVQNWPNLCELAKQWDIPRVLGADLGKGPGVDVEVDFDLDAAEFRKTWTYGQFDTVAVFNVLEHVFDPVHVLKNALTCLSAGGTLLLVVPTVWPLHDFPRDYARLMPHWFEELGARHNLTLVRDAFCWLSVFGCVRVDSLTTNGQYELPTSANLGKIQAPLRYWKSRVLHRLFNTYGRTHVFTYAALGVAYRSPA